MSEQKEQNFTISLSGISLSESEAVKIEQEILRAALSQIATIDFKGDYAIKDLRAS